MPASTVAPWPYEDMYKDEVLDSIDAKVAQPEKGRNYAVRSPKPH